VYAGVSAENAPGVGAFQIPGVATFDGSSQGVAPGVFAVSSLRAGVLPPSLFPHAGVRLPDDVQAGVLDPDAPQAGVFDPDVAPPHAGVRDPDVPHAGVLEPDPVQAGVRLLLPAFQAGVRPSSARYAGVLDPMPYAGVRDPVDVGVQDVRGVPATLMSGRSRPTNS